MWKYRLVEERVRGQISEVGFTVYNLKCLVTQ